MMKNITTGIDLVEISRIKRSATPHFIERIFSPKERELFDGKKNPLQSIASNFAAKEAFGKALGTGIRGFAFCEVSVLRDKFGAPYYEFSGKAKKIVELNQMSFSLSISNTDNYAIASTMAICYKD